MMQSLTLTFTLLVTTSAFAGDSDTVDFSAVEKTVRRALPNTQITHIQPSPIEGLVEIVAGRNVLYADPTGRYLVVGSLYDTHTATDLTAERKSAASTIEWKSLPLDAAVKYGGKGPLTLAVFIDPDCPWCKKLHQQLASLKEVQIYLLFYPVEELHPGARSKTAAILCAADPLKALDSAMTGAALPQSSDPACLDQATAKIANVERFARNHNIHGTPTLISGDGRVRAGFLDEQSLRAWLDASKQ
jgi:thiol:disulfide interchange protein DsbC